MARIGVQAMMLKDDIARDGAYETLRRVHELGYRTIELSQVPMTGESVAEIDRARHDFDLEIAAVSAALRSAPGALGDSLEDDFDKIVADAAALDCSIVRMGMLPWAALSSLESVLDFCDKSNAMAARLADHGIQLCYHNHHMEFAKHDGVLLLDRIAERAPLMGFEIDVHWVHRGGVDPSALIRRYGDRVVLVHLKDYRIGPIPDAAFEALAAGDSAPFESFFANPIEFAEVGEGTLDFPGIIEASLSVGSKYLFVEQDVRYGRTALECLDTSLRNLRSLGFGHLL